MKFIKNRYLVFGIILLALLSTLVSFNLFFRESANERKIAAIEDRLRQSEDRLDIRLSQIEDRLDIFEARFKQTEDRLDIFEARFKSIEEGLDRFEARFKQIEYRLDILDAVLVRREILNLYDHNASSTLEEKPAIEEPRQ